MQRNYIKIKFIFTTKYYEIKDETYINVFNAKESTFIYNVRLEVRKLIWDIRSKIDQNKEYYEKIEYFLKALKYNREESLIDFLYEESIKIYKKRKGFSFLIILFLKIHRKKDLCNNLLKIFKEINQSSKENEKNMDRNPFLKVYTSNLNNYILSWRAIKKL